MRGRMQISERLYVYERMRDDSLERKRVLSRDLTI